MQHFKRSFRLWDYRVSHDQLLLRSAKGPNHPRNLDVAFVGVEYIELPTMLRDLAFAPPVQDDLRRAEVALGRVPPLERVFAIESSERHYVIVAAAVRVFENDLEYSESSLERF